MLTRPTIGAFFLTEFSEEEQDVIKSRYQNGELSTDALLDAVETLRALRSSSLPGEYTEGRIKEVRAILLRN